MLLAHGMPHKSTIDWYEGIEITEIGHLQFWLAEAQNQSTTRAFWLLLDKSSWLCTASNEPGPPWLTDISPSLEIYTASSYRKCPDIQLS